jgi:hypothetical protein
LVRLLVSCPLFFLIALGAPMAVLVLRWRSMASIAAHSLESEFCTSYVSPTVKGFSDRVLPSRRRAEP